MYFPQQRLLQCFLFRIRSHICLLNNTTNTKKEHSQLFRQLSVEFLVRPIHFVHFIRPHESVAQTYREIFKSALVYLSFEILQHLIKYMTCINPQQLGKPTLKNSSRKWINVFCFGGKLREYVYVFWKQLFCKNNYKSVIGAKLRPCLLF